jgi:hypothetical protein
MLNEVNHWIAIIGTAADALLLCRVLLLKLQRVYLFITLACVLALFFDGVDLWLENDQDGNLRVFLYSRFLFAFLFPLVVWDVFEEMKSQISNIRRIAGRKLVSGIFFATVFGVVLTVFVQAADTSGQPIAPTLGLVLWTGSSTASLAFLWTLRRAIGVQNIGVPSNTAVWLVFWQLFLLAQVLTCFYFLIGQYLGHGTEYVLNIAFNTYGIVITAWCILRLRALPSDVPSAPANASL